MMSEMVAVCEESALGAPVWCVANGMWAEWGVIRARAVPAGPGGDACWVVEDWRRVRAGSLVTPDGMPSSTHGGLRTPDALRAALASAAKSVGAPVIAPAEDGRPTLAEWIAPFDERGRRLRCTYHDGSLGLWHFLSGAVVGWQSDSDDLGPEGPVLYRDGRSEGVYIPNPAELRAILDELASRGGVP